MIDVDDLSLLGGHPALDFVNTIEDRDGLTPDDVLRTPDDLVRWARRTGLTAGADDPHVSVAELSRAVDLREDLHAVLHALVTHGSAPAPALRRVSEVIAEASGARHLTQGAGGLEWGWTQPSGATIRHGVALEAGALLTDAALLARTRRCAAELCGWFYLDHSKNHSRRWCSMRVCGTREKARRRARRDGAAGS